MLPPISRILFRLVELTVGIDGGPFSALLITVLIFTFGLENLLEVKQI
jgi:hypothetical protein